MNELEYFPRLNFRIILVIVFDFFFFVIAEFHFTYSQLQDVI